MARQRKVKFNALRITIEAVVPTNETSSGEIEESIDRALDELRAFGMAKVVTSSPCEYPDYDAFTKDSLRHIDFSGNVSIYVG